MFYCEYLFPSTAGSIIGACRHREMCLLTSRMLVVLAWQLLTHAHTESCTAVQRPSTQLAIPKIAHLAMQLGVFCRRCALPATKLADGLWYPPYHSMRKKFSTGEFSLSNLSWTTSPEAVRRPTFHSWRRNPIIRSINPKALDRSKYTTCGVKQKKRDYSPNIEKVLAESHLV